MTKIISVVLIFDKDYLGSFNIWQRIDKPPNYTFTVKFELILALADPYEKFLFLVMAAILNWFGIYGILSYRMGSTQGPSMASLDYLAYWFHTWED